MLERDFSGVLVLFSLRKLTVTAAYAGEISAEFQYSFPSENSL
jgi:hypothetical protein